jgi:hypothetical protein
MSKASKSDPNGGICSANCTGQYGYLRLTNGEVVKVDAEDLPRLVGHTWGVNRAGGYAQTGIGKVIVRMHRLIMDAPQGVQVDHINGNKLDNTKANLRLCTRSQNGANKPVQDRHGRPYKGVYAWGKRWKAVVAGKHVGLFRTPEEAAMAYDRAALERWGEFAATNFPSAT